MLTVKRILASRGLMSATVVVTLVLAAAIGLKLSRPHPQLRGYCADMPDSIGLYQGSAVTIMGVPVGRVTDIEPDGTSARVRFEIRADRTLPPDVGAVTVSDTLVADRKLALIGAEPAGPGWDPAHCITKTLTPKSLSETFTALAGLVDKLDGTRDPSQRTALADGLDALDNATAGTGERINAILHALSRALRSPDAAIGHLGKLLDALTELAHRARGGWDRVQDTVTGLPQTFGDIDTIAFPPIIDLVAALAEVLPQANDALMMLGSPALRALDSIPNLPNLIASGVGSLAEVIRMTPAVATGFASAVDPVSGKPSIGYAPPKLALAQQDTDQICTAVRALTGQGCQNSGGVVTVPALPALLAAAGAR
ncbi:MlaD family protein [Nocardia sp. CA-151230]|uniref:MlaD family protein n=1 Tax=Nocardia sp. CA-151230 TaxID=3239982 RepID=UPI003D92D9A3